MAAAKPTVDIPDDVPTDLNGDDHFAYIVGYPNGNVEPNGNITRAEVATIFFRLLTEEVRTANSTQSNSLSDVRVVSGLTMLSPRCPRWAL